MDQTITGVVHGNTIVLDVTPPVPEGTRVEVVVLDRHFRSASNDGDCLRKALYVGLPQSQSASGTQPDRKRAASTG